MSIKCAKRQSSLRKLSVSAVTCFLFDITAEPQKTLSEFTTATTGITGRSWSQVFRPVRVVGLQEDANEQPPCRAANELLRSSSVARAAAHHQGFGPMGHCVPVMNIDDGRERMARGKSGYHGFCHPDLPPGDAVPLWNEDTHLSFRTVLREESRITRHSQSSRSLVITLGMTAVPEHFSAAYSRGISTPEYPIDPEIPRGVPLGMTWGRTPWGCSREAA